MVPTLLTWRLVVLMTFLTVGKVASENNTSQTGQRWSYRPRARTSSSRLIPVVPHSRPLYRLYLPSVVSENIITGNDTISEASIEFRPIKAYQLDDITRAFLNITLTNPASSGEGWILKLIGVSSSIISGNSSSTSSTPIGDTFPSNTSSFDVLQYLRNVTLEDRQLSNGGNRREWMHAIRIVFKVRRPCSPQFCQTFLDTGLRLPFLKVDYTADVDADGDVHVQELLGVVGSRMK